MGLGSNGAAGDAFAGAADGGQPGRSGGVLAAIAVGVATVDAARLAGVSEAVGVRWFRERGGMATFMLDEVSCRYLCLSLIHI